MEVYLEGLSVPYHRRATIYQKCLFSMKNPVLSLYRRLHISFGFADYHHPFDIRLQSIVQRTAQKLKMAEFEVKHLQTPG